MKKLYFQSQGEKLLTEVQGHHFKVLKLKLKLIVKEYFITTFKIMQRLCVPINEKKKFNQKIDILFQLKYARLRLNISYRTPYILQILNIISAQRVISLLFLLNQNANATKSKNQKSSCKSQ